MKIVNIRIPEKSSEFGTFQLEKMLGVTYRFDFSDGKAVLDSSLFAENEPDPEKRFRQLPRESTLYQNLQKTLSDIIEEG